MTLEQPTDVKALLARVGRDSLVRSFQQLCDENPPDYILNSQGEMRRAEQEWRKNFASEINLLGIAAQRALVALEQNGVQSAMVEFTSNMLTQPELDAFMHCNPYLQELFYDAMRDKERLRNLLDLFVQLSRLDSQP